MSIRTRIKTFQGQTVFRDKVSQREWVILRSSESDPSFCVCRLLENNCLQQTAVIEGGDLELAFE